MGVKQPVVARSRILQGAQEALEIASDEMPQDAYAVHIPEENAPPEGVDVTEYIT